MKLTNKKRKLILLTIITVLCATLLVVGLYANDYYHADKEALECLIEPDESLTILTMEDIIIFTPQTPRAGLIFYPGGKVQYEAYAPLMKACAEQGILCVLVKMPLNLAVLDVNAADGIKEKVAEQIGMESVTGIEVWYMGGHSLGGSMAASYIEKHAAEYDGLILLASYSTADLSGSDLQVISVYGTEDKVLNLEKYEQYKVNLPADFRELVIEGGCHAYFGSYGLQEGDGVPKITREEQIQVTVDALGEWMQGE